MPAPANAAGHNAHHQLPSPTGSRPRIPGYNDLSFDGPLKALRVSACGGSSDVARMKKLTGLLSWCPEDRTAWPFLKERATGQAVTGGGATFSPSSSSPHRRPISAAVGRHILPAATSKLVLRPGQILAPAFCEENNGIRSWNGGRNLYKAPKSPLQPLMGETVSSAAPAAIADEGPSTLPAPLTPKPLTHVTLTLAEEAGQQVSKATSRTRRQRPKSGVVMRSKQISYVDDGLFAVSTAPIHSGLGRTSAPQLPTWNAKGSLTQDVHMEERSLADGVEHFEAELVPSDPQNWDAAPEFGEQQQDPPAATSGSESVHQPDDPR
mmetsp:Transcript_8278/g.14836  ORF Transcript_8278/g.14836 Transcript_8278/m.14836 type:complete len:323 (+) Transcript_8278:96-1064(+)